MATEPQILSSLSPVYAHLLFCRESSYLRAYKALSRPRNEYPVAVMLLVSFIVFRLRLKLRFTLNATDTSCASASRNSPLHLSRTLYKSTLFMQNKPNFRKSQMNVNTYNTTDYEDIANWTLGESKPNSNPIKPNSNPNKPNFRKAKMNVNSLITKDYRKNNAFAVRKTKSNSNPISEKPKMNANVFITKDYENETAFRLQKNKPNQTLS